MGASPAERDDDRSSLTAPPPLTRSIGEKGGCAIGALKKRCARKKAKPEKCSETTPTNERNRHTMTKSHVKRFELKTRIGKGRS